MKFLQTRDHIEFTYLSSFVVFLPWIQYEEGKCEEFQNELRSYIFGQYKGAKVYGFWNGFRIETAYETLNIQLFCEDCDLDLVVGH